MRVAASSIPDAPDTLTFSAGGTLPPGLLIDPATGIISGTIDNNASASGPYGVTITADDGNGGSTTQTFTWSVSNPAPAATDDDFFVNENGTITGNVVSGDNGNGTDFDSDGDAILVSHVNGLAGNVGTGVGGTNGGSFLISGDGTFMFDSGSDFDDLAVGETRITTASYTISDSDGATSSATVSVTVTGENDSPTPVGTIADQSNNDSEAVTLDVSGFFADLDLADTLVYSHGGTLPPGLSIDPGTGVINGTLANDASSGGPYSVTVTVDDGNGGSAAQTFTWNVSNPVPIATDDDLATTEHGTLTGNAISTDNGNGADSDPDGDALAVSAVAGSAGNVGTTVSGSNGGSFVVNSDGSLTFDAGTSFDDLAVGETRDTSVTYTITDVDGSSNTATITVTITGENDAPNTVGSLANRSNSDGESVAINISSAFGDVDATDALAYSDGGTLPPGLSLNASTGEISGTIDHDASSGGPYAVVITANDGNGDRCRNHSLGPSAIQGRSPTDDAFSSLENGSATGNVVTGNNGNGVDTDVDGDSIVVTHVGGSSGNVGTTVVGSGGGTLRSTVTGPSRLPAGADFDSMSVGETRDTFVTYTIHRRRRGNQFCNGYRHRFRRERFADAGWNHFESGEQRQRFCFN